MSGGKGFRLASSSYVIAGLPAFKSMRLPGMVPIFFLIWLDTLMLESEKR